MGVLRFAARPLRAPWLAFALGCASNGGAATPPTKEPAATPAPAPAPAAAVPALSAKGFADVRVGAALPPAHASEPQYRASYYADAQPLEGFELDVPGVLAIVDGGAFAAFGNEHPGEPPTAEVRARTLAASAASALTVRMLVVTSPSIVATGGVRVGTDMQTFRQAFPDPPLRRIPPLWEDPTCVIEAAGLHFFFDRCPGNDQEPVPRNAKVVRIVARD